MHCRRGREQQHPWTTLVGKCYGEMGTQRCETRSQRCDADQLHWSGNESEQRIIHIAHRFPLAAEQYDCSRFRCLTRNARIITSDVTRAVSTGIVRLQKGRSRRYHQDERLRRSRPGSCATAQNRIVHGSHGPHPLLQMRRTVARRSGKERHAD